MKFDLLKAKKFIIDKNIIPKFISLIAAVILWIYITSKNTGEMELKIPLTVTNLSEKFVIKEMASKYISVSLKGNREDVKNVEKKYIKTMVNLKKVLPGEPVKYDVILERSEVPDNIEVTLNDKKVFILVEKVLKKTVPIAPVMELNLDEGYFAGNISIKPDKVTLSGGESVVEGIEKVDTDTIILKKVKSTYEQDIELNISKLENVSVDTKIVKVKIPVFNAREVSKFEVPIVIVNENEFFKYVMEPQKVQIYVRHSPENTISPEKIKAEIVSDVISVEQFKDKKIFETQNMVKIYISDTLKDVEVIEVSPLKIKVTIEKK